MKIEDIREKLNPEFYKRIVSFGITDLRPSQEKSVNRGLLDGNNVLVCTPTASGKTFVAELAMINQIANKGVKAIYVAPFKALASEKFKQMSSRYHGLARIAISTGDLDSDSPSLSKYDLIICTQEKLDSLLRHNSPWVDDVKVAVFDEIHLINDESRGPTLEIIITLLREKIKNIQIIGLSATIGNPKELASWLDAELIEDNWRPVKLEKGILTDNRLYFYKI